MAATYICMLGAGKAQHRNNGYCQHSTASTSVQEKATPRALDLKPNNFLALLLKLWHCDQWSCENCRISGSSPDLFYIYFLTRSPGDLYEHESLRSLALQDLRREDIHKQIKLSYVVTKIYTKGLSITHQAKKLPKRCQWLRRKYGRQ